MIAAPYVVLLVLLIVTEPRRALAHDLLMGSCELYRRSSDRILSLLEVTKVAEPIKEITLDLYLRARGLSVGSSMFTNSMSLDRRS